MEGYYNIDADGKADSAEVNPGTAEYTYIATNSPSPGENEDQTDPYTTVNDKKGSRDRLMLDPADDELGDAAVFANKHAVADDVAQRPRSVTQPAIDSQHGQSAECAVIAEVTHSTPHTPPPSSQDYATIPDKELEEVLYDMADHESLQEADTQATPPTADSIVKPVQEGTDDTEQPPPVPAFDPDILYTQPDKTSKAKDGGYETIPDTSSPATAEGNYESVDMPHASTGKQPKVPSLATTHHKAPNFGYGTVPEASAPVADGGYEAVDIPHTKTAAAREADARKLPDKPTASRPGQPTGSIYETISDSTLPQPADAPPGYEAVHYPPSSHSAQGRSPPVQSTGSDGDNLYAEPERTVEQRAAKDKADGYATVDDKGGKVALPQRPIPADELYSTPDMSQKKNRRRESQGSVGGEGPEDTPPDTPTAVDQLYATPDMSKKQTKQPQVSPSEEQ